MCEERDREGLSADRCPDGRTRGWPWWGVVLVVCCALAGAAQELPDEDGEGDETKLKVPLTLLEREPFDELTVTSDEGPVVLEIMPLDSVPSNPRSTDRLRVRLLTDATQWYEVAWQHIVRLRTHRQLMLEEAQRLVAEKKYNEAFRYFEHVLGSAPADPRLRNVVLDYLLEDAAERVRDGSLDHALAVLEEVVRRDPDYRRAEVATRMAEVVDRLVAADIEREDYGRARGIIARLENAYGASSIESLGRWRQQLVDQATELKRQAEERLAAGEYRLAERLVRRTRAIWPDLAGAAELETAIAREYPMVIVGVTEAAGYQDPTSIDNWAARRTGRLTQRTLLEFLGAGPEGGQYLCAFGDFFQSDDRRRLTLELHAGDGEPSGDTLTGYDVARHVLDMADPTSPDYRPPWAALMSRVRVENVFKVQMELRRPHVLPEAMLQIQLREHAGQSAPPMSVSQGPYRPADGEDEQRHFVANRRAELAEDAGPAEIVERHFASSEAAAAALRRGDIDVIDGVLPDVAARLRADESLQVTAYALPTLHLLVPNLRRPLTANRTFRRALVYGINRPSILQTELLGGGNVAGCQVVSGPFPIGTRNNDPLAYAYNPRVVPHAYSPRLASLLKTLARRELSEMASRGGEPPPTPEALVIGYPATEIARIACQAISQYLEVVGIETELRELPPGVTADPTGEIDLLYVQVAMWEPVIDARRLLGSDGVAAGTNEYVAMALRRLDAARNWREARERLHDLHRIVHEQVAVIPLWQTVNHCVHNRRLSGVGTSPLTLYQDVEQWRITR